MEPQEKNHPVNIHIEYPERPSRGLAVCTLLFFIPKAIILIPHFILLYFISIFCFIVGIFAQFAVLFTGKYPRGMFDIMVGAYRWQLRINAYLFGLTDTYPPFQLKS